jgi:hypothetical protein
MDDDYRAVSETLEALGGLLHYGITTWRETTTNADELAGEFREMLLTGGTIAIAQTLLITVGSTDVLRMLADHGEVPSFPLLG